MEKQVCKRCQYEWIPKGHVPIERIRSCPACKSRYWRVERIQDHEPAKAETVSVKEREW